MLLPVDVDDILQPLTITLDLPKLPSMELLEEDDDEDDEEEDVEDVEEFGATVFTPTSMPLW